MKILFLHGWQSVPGSVKPTFLKAHGHEVINPKLSDEDFAEAVRIAQAEFDTHQPQAVVGSSRGGAVAMSINSGEARLVLLCPAWKKHGNARRVKPGTVILHSRADDVVPFADSEELVRNSGLPPSALVEVGDDHRLADPEPLRKMLAACGGAPVVLNPGDVVRVIVRKTAVFGLFCEYGTHEILVLIPEISWIPSFASCEQAAAVGDELEVKIVHIDRERNKIAGSVRALHPESDPWHGVWQLGVGDVLEATVVRWVEKADRCGDAGGYLLALRPAALVMLCGQEAGRLKSGDRVAVRVTAIDAHQGKVTVALVP
ncbi:MAG TPA: S1 RNA-binding domain-containing protein [Gemmataceae bacterium]|nr:S1 RNA-binding domain-containing protein [Gemmataceae bacterium]